MKDGKRAVVLSGGGTKGAYEIGMNSMKRQNDRILKEELPRSVGAQYASGELTPERMKGWSQIKNNTQLWM